jgi:protein O-mannosyl-transferase
MSRDWLHRSFGTSAAAERQPAREKFPAAGRARAARTVLAALLLAGTVAAIYLQVSGHRFINFDDIGYIVENRMVQGGLSWAGLRYALTTFDCSNWHPLTWLAHMVDCSLWGDWAGGHLLGNAALHLATTLLVFLFFRRNTGRFWPSFWVALVFGVHPAHVESVAWASEKKDVLCAFLVLATLLAYGEYAKRGRRWGWWGALGCFALALMAKPMAVTVPCLLLVLDFWPLRRDAAGATAFPARLVLEKVPFFLLSGIGCYLTLLAQRGAMLTGEGIPWAARLSNAVVSYWKYVAKLLVPANLSFFYPFPERPPLALALLAAAGLLAVTAAAFALRRKRPYLLSGWFWFAGLLVPVIGLVQVGVQSMADRYTYLPSIGLSVAVVWPLDALATHRRRILAVTLAGCALCGVYAVGAWRQVGYWKDNEALYRRALAVNSANSEAWFNIALHFHREKRFSQAERCYRSGLTIRPDDANGNYNFGVLLFETGRLDESVARLQQACRLKPDYVKARMMLRLVWAARAREQAAPPAVANR